MLNPDLETLPFCLLLQKWQRRKLFTRRSTLLMILWHGSMRDSLSGPFWFRQCFHKVLYTVPVLRTRVDVKLNQSVSEDILDKVKERTLFRRFRGNFEFLFWKPPNSLNAPVRCQVLSSFATWVCPMVNAPVCQVVWRAVCNVKPYPTYVILTYGPIAPASRT
jgi:hypothetical protein